MRVYRVLCVFLIVLSSAACARAPGVERVAPAQRAYDVIIENGRVVDGTGNAWYLADVALRGDRIARVAAPGTLRSATATRRIDARGMVVAPGFIDIQGHSLGLLLQGDSRVVGKVTQGVTTEILGEGSTPAPANERTQGDLSAQPAAARAMMERLRQPDGFDAWMQMMESRGVSVNVGSFVGGSTLRQFGMGLEMGAAPPAALDSMRAALARAMQDGAFGLATALIYPPGNYASTDELIGVSRAMAPYGGVYITHMRSEADHVLEAMDEAIRIGREAGVPVEIYHLKAAGRANWGKTPAMISKIDSARRAGLDVQANMYPYPAGGTGLTACLPPWAEEGGRLFERLADSAERRRIRTEIERPTSEWENLCAQATPEGVLIASLRTPQYQQYAGQRLSQISAALGRDWIATAMDLILTERRRVETMYYLMSEENVALKMQQPWMKFGTDAGGPDPDSVTSLLHPRAFGTYPRIMGRYVRDEAVLTLEEAVRKSTSAVATRLGIRERGQLVEGWYADIVLFDPTAIIDRATFEQPLQLSTGVRHVFVNGVQVLRDGAHTGAKPGVAVRGPGWRGWGGAVTMR